MNFVNHKEWACHIPKLVPMEQTFDESLIADSRKEASSTVSDLFEGMSRIRKGGTVGVAVGSRGIGAIPKIVAGVVEAVKKIGCFPFIFPAMGSHGGENPLGKIQILERLGITETSVGAPISQTMGIALVGQAGPDLPIYCHAEALSADAIILLNRVKPHTDFRGTIESGLIKMAVVGLGGELGAQWVHSQGYEHLGARIRVAGEAAIKMLPIHFGVAIVEGHSRLPFRIEAIPRDKISSREEALLREARRLVPKLPLKHLDVLVVGEMGKNISGTGLDPTVTGRYPSGKLFAGDDVPDIYRIAVLDLTDASSGNSVGVGLCDVTTRKLMNKTDFAATYKNVITGRGSASARVPMVMESDREAISVALLTCTQKPEDAEIVLIRNTQCLDRFLASESAVPQCESMGARVVGKPVELSFDSNGSLMLRGWMQS